MGGKRDSASEIPSMKGQQRSYYKGAHSLEPPTTGFRSSLSAAYCPTLEESSTPIKKPQT